MKGVGTINVGNLHIFPYIFIFPKK